MPFDLETLITQYGAMHDAPSDEYDAHFFRLKTSCEEIAQVQRCSWRDVMAFIRKKYFLKIAAEDKREGRK